MKLKIMTFNIRVSGADDGKCSFPYRKHLIKEVISQHAPHLIGFQEVTDEALAYLRSAISDAYEIIACGRERGLHGESVAIAYKRDAFVPIKSETFWLSPTPNIPASTYGEDQSSCPRIATYALLKPEDGQVPVIFMNTHFDHQGVKARLLEAKQMLALIKACDYPVFLSGDFNMRPDTAEERLLSSSLTDLTQASGGTFHFFGRENYTPVKIDYIFTSARVISSSCEVITTHTDDGIYPSDHYPVMVTVEL